MNPLPSPGSVLSGKYRVLRLIGEGGMGAVFEAENVRTQKRIALKWLRADASQHEQASARMVREAQAAARVRHPNVVDVYDVESEGDAVFLVMEYLEGEPLTRVLARRELRMSELIALLLQAMRGVAAAHKQGVIHRDLKPDNIFVAHEGEGLSVVPKVLDFGISRLEPRGDEPLVLTRTGTTMGTPLYMSYEQLSGVKDIDARTDVYALGVILYEGLTGEPPYSASTFSELVVKIATQPVSSPRALRSEIPAALAEVVLHAMARDRDQRFASVDALIRALEPFATDAGFRTHQTDPGRPVPLLAGGAAASPKSAPVDAATTAARPEARQRDGRRELVVSAAQSTRPQRVEVRRRRRRWAVAAFLVVAAGGAAAARLLIPSHPTPPPVVTAGLVPVVRSARLGRVVGEIRIEDVELVLASAPTRVEPAEASEGETPREAERGPSEGTKRKVLATTHGPKKNTSKQQNGVGKPVTNPTTKPPPADSQAAAASGLPKTGDKGAGAGEEPQSEEPGFRVNRPPTADDFYSK